MAHRSFPGFDPRSSALVLGVLATALSATTASCSCSDSDDPGTTGSGGAGVGLSTSSQGAGVSTERGAGAGANGSGTGAGDASGGGGAGVGAGGPEAPGEADDFVGPFAGWVDVKADPDFGGAVGDGVADDTAALQAAIEHLRDDGFPRVIYLPAGTYRITETLRMADLDEARIVGEDPALVTILWDGAAGADMVDVDAVNGTKIERITFEGSSTASAGIRQEVTQQNGNYSGMNLYLDLIFQNLEYGLRSPAELDCFQADAEIVVERSWFRNISVAGVEASSANSFNWFVWHSRFEDCAIGVQNGPVTNSGACQGNGYAEMFVQESTFLRSTNCDVKNVASARGNLSVGSRAFQRHDPFVGRPIADQQSFFRNVILDPTDAVAIDFASPIAYAVDNVIRSGAGAAGPVIQGRAHLVAIGNQLTVSEGIAATGRISDVDNTVVEASSIVVDVPDGPVFAVKRDREIFEVLPSDQGIRDEEIQLAVDAAVAFEAANPGSRPVVHLPGQGGVPGVGSLNVNSAVVIPAGTDIQILGDGWKTSVVFDDESVTDQPIFRVQGPTKVRFSDLYLWGNRPGAPEANALSAIEVTGGDQPGSRYYSEATLLAGPGYERDQLGLWADGLSHMKVYAASHFSGTVRVRGGDAPGDAFVALFGSANVTARQDGPGTPAYEVIDGGSLLVEDAYAESNRHSDGTLYMQYLSARGSGANPGRVSVSITQNKGTIDLFEPTTQYAVDAFAGTLSFLQGTYWLGTLDVTGDPAVAAQTQVLAIGNQFFDPGSYPPETRILMTNRGQPDSGWNADQPDVVVNVDDQAAFIREALAFRREVKPPTWPLPATPEGTTDVRVSRLFVLYGREAEVVLRP